MGGLKRIIYAIGLIFLVGMGALTWLVESESEYRVELLGGTGPVRALVLYHPSRDAGFSDQLSLALAQGLMESGLSVDRATLTGVTPARPKAYRLIAVVSNTYFWTPDWPSLDYLHRAELEGIPAIGIIGGAGATARAERVLHEALLASGAGVMETRSLWILRPNDEQRMAESNRAVAVDLARKMGVASGLSVLSQLHAGN